MSDLAALAIELEFDAAKGTISWWCTNPVKYHRLEDSGADVCNSAVNQLIAQAESAISHGGQTKAPNSNLIISLETLQMRVSYFHSRLVLSRIYSNDVASLLTK